jgi:protein-export membrane protein SecD
MSDRTPLKLFLIAALVVVALFINADLAQSGYEYPERARALLAWQGEETVRNFTLRRGLDLQGGLQVLMQVSPETPHTRADLDDAATIIQNRVDSLGVTEAKVQIQGDDKIVVELPGVDDPDLAVRTIGRTAALEFIYGGDPSDPVQSPLLPTEGVTVTTTFPAEWPDLPDDNRTPRLMDQADLDALRARAGAAERDEEAASPVTSTLSGGLAGTPTDTEPTDTAPTDTAPTGAAATGAEPTDSDVAGTATDESGTSEPGDSEATGAATAGLGTSEPGATESASATPADAGATTDDDDGNAKRVYPTVLSGRHIRSAVAQLDQLNQWVVAFTLDAPGGKTLSEFTRDHIEHVMPIVLDGQVISSPRINDLISSSGQISGNFDQASAESLAIQLRSGALPVTLDHVGQSRIGPTLGAQSVHMAVIGGVVGMVAVITFMILYYRVPGVLASIALLIYVLLSLTVFRLMPVTLTLAGIAGFVLSIGMAVDANILIFERMKEELRAGRRMTPAIRTGFERAWPSIRDSNLSTLITCVILFWFGSQFGASIVKGFAVTLAVGVLTSVFTAITVTRTFLEATTKYGFRGSMTAQPAESPRLRTLFGF